MSDTAFEELTKTATSLDYNQRIILLNLLAQSLYSDEIPQFKEGKNGLDEAIAEIERGEVFYYNNVDEMFADAQNA
ncbi:MAG: hypothetical protein SO112_05490 [Treponema sp.]|nr:hypothetical protein [Treponema sp.]MDY4985456.1 hypothetical protein [Treponema sp.]